MAGNIRYKFLHLEVPPPENSWQAIEARLQEEYIPAEAGIAQKLDGYNTPPPPQSWDTIAHALDNAAIPAPQRLYDLEATPPTGSWQQITAALDHQPVQQAPVRSIARRSAIAAAVAALVILGSVLIYNMATRTSPAAPQVAGNTPATQQDPAMDATAPSPEPSPVSIAHSTAQRTTRRSSSGGSITHTAYYNNYNPQPIPALLSMGYANVKPATQPVTTSPIRVEAPPIRDANGNIILNEKLIASPGDPYITVTSPNGEQTRLSRKFLSVLGYMNPEPDQDGYNVYVPGESVLWQIQFEQWRNKILSQTSFIPTATNFMDILEMQDIFDEQL